MSSNGRLIQLKSLDQVPLYPVIKTSNVINDAHFIGVSDSGELGQVLTKTASGPRWATLTPSGQSAIATVANYLEITQADIQYNTYTFSNSKIPISIQSPQGHYYTIEKSSVYVQQQTSTLDLAPYLAYQGVSVFSGTWKLYVLPVLSSDVASVFKELSDSIAAVHRELQSKAGINLENLTSSAKSLIQLYSYELDYANAVEDQTSVNVVYTTATGGIIVAYGINATSNLTAFTIQTAAAISGDYDGFQTGGNLETSISASLYIMVPKGWQYIIRTTGGPSIYKSRFIPFKNS